MPSIVDNIYPPVLVSMWWMITAITVLIGAVAGYYVVRWLRVRLALKRQQKLLLVAKPHKAEIISRALQELAHIRQEVAAGTLPAHQGAQQLSLTARTAFDAIMNHATQFSAKYEVAARSLRAMTEMLDEAYPAEFAVGRPDAGAFDKVYNQAVKVVQSCS
jgi:hypothetical protein